MELNGQLADEGFAGRWGCLMTGTYKQLGDRHLSMLRREMGEYGVIRDTRVRGLHFEFFDKQLGGFYLRNADDPEKYRGGQFDWILYDELTEIRRIDYDDIDYALRSGDPLPFKSFGWASNPDGLGHAWVKKLWIESDFANEAKELDPADFVFIQARATDNPAFDSTIQAKLMGHSDPLKVKARWEGSWDLNFGARFSQFSQVHRFNWDQFCQEYGGDYGPMELLGDESLFTLFGSFDYGISEESASCLLVHAVDWKRRVWTIDELYMPGMFLDEQADRIRTFLALQAQPLNAIYCDPALRGRDDQGISRWAKFRNRGVPMSLGKNNRIEGWATLDEMLHYRRDGSTGLIEVPPRWRIHEKCKHLIRQMQSAPRSPKDSSDIDDAFDDDHALDSARYGLHTRFASPVSRVAEPEMFSVQWMKQRRRKERREQREQSWII